MPDEINMDDLPDTKHNSRRLVQFQFKQMFVDYKATCNKCKHTITWTEWPDMDKLRPPMLDE